MCTYVLWVFHGDCVLSRTPFSRLYQFSGTSSSSSLLAEPAFQPVFARYQGKEAVPPECILSTPGSGDVGTIAVWPGRQTSTPQNLAWVTSEGKGDGCGGDWDYSLERTMGVGREGSVGDCGVGIRREEWGGKSCWECDDLKWLLHRFIYPLLSPPDVCSCLLSDDGIFLLQFDFKPGSSKFLVQRDLLPHLSAQGGAAQLPLAVALTEFHVVLLHRDRWVWQEGVVGGCGNWVWQVTVALHSLVNVSGILLLVFLA